MRVFIAGIDGYLGWTLAIYLINRGYVVAGCDSGIRRTLVSSYCGADSVTPILGFTKRMDIVYSMTSSDLCLYDGLVGSINEFNPDCIVHLAQIPSAPFSMMERWTCLKTILDNVSANINLLYAIKETGKNIHLVKLGTMGEYGTPDLPIPEGFFECEYKGHKDILPFPRQPGSWYHLSKVHDSLNIEFANKIWGITCTDIMQGVVYGSHIDEMQDSVSLRTRFDIDECFGTVLNRFTCQALSEYPLTIYGEGHQQRGFLPLKDSMQCIKLIIDNPPKSGEYRVINQFEEVYSIYELAEMVKKVGREFNLDVKIENLSNPRVEKDRHFYRPEHSTLFDLGYKPTTDIENEIYNTMLDLLPYRERINKLKNHFKPSVKWTI